MLTLYPARLLFLSTLSLGVLITISSSSWFGCWLGLELNLMSFIPILTSKHDIYSSEAALKYFLIQAFGSAIILTGVCISCLYTQLANVVIMTALLLKSGAAPLHFWFPPVMQGIKIPQCIILMTIQKIAPMILISYTLTLQGTALPLIMASILSSIIGAVGGLNQTLTRKIMAYSSINHMAWMLAAVSCSLSLWSFYFFIYSVISSTVMLLFYQQQILHISQVVNENFKTPTLKIMIFMSLISLGGLPPFLGFIPKMFVIMTMATHGQFLWLVFLLFSTLLTLFFYLRISLAAFSIASFKIKSMGNYSSTSFLTVSLINFIPLFSPLLMMLPY